MAKPEWSNKIRALRAYKGWSGAELGARLGVSAMAVSRWERGENAPPAEALIRLGTLAGDPDCWYFWEQAGLSKSEIARVVPDLEQRLFSRAQPNIEVVAARGSVKENDKTVRLKKRPEVVALPLLKDSAAAGSPRLIEEANVEDVLLVPARFCPHPIETTCIRISGDSMSPLLEDGYVVAVDTAEVEAQRLYNEMVAARDPEGGVTIKWLRKVGPDLLLVPQHTSTRYQPIILTRTSGWKIVGRVVWWLGFPPAPRGRG